ncbi:hypothetical protein PVAND_014208 [Polypedilum vanderplanki]|uniref:Uncharacterized protein n=1 Tax=Polypedilum vanderplanki TaxID=319348 RepID=A0A9J6CSG0_POLVA|nr:hypothetical protein PVAND_014208 [Polypedilum vanderplanki]
MIERKRGRIVSVCSTTAFTPIPSTTVYSGTKWGLRGFMNCLNAELLLNNQDKFIKTTTVFPEFMNTRKELTDVLDKINFKLSRLNPERVADETVKGMLNNEQEVLICDVKIGVYITSYLSSSGIKHLLKSSAKLDKIFDSKQSK